MIYLWSLFFCIFYIDLYLVFFIQELTGLNVRDVVKLFQEKGIETSYEEVLENIKDRDKRDSTRKISPLKKAEDAIYIDSSDMTIEEVVDKVITLIKEKYKK